MEKKKNPSRKAHGARRMICDIPKQDTIPSLVSAVLRSLPKPPTCNQYTIIYTPSSSTYITSSGNTSCTSTSFYYLPNRLSTHTHNHPFPHLFFIFRNIHIRRQPKQANRQPVTQALVPAFKWFAKIVQCVRLVFCIIFLLLLLLGFGLLRDFSA